MKGLRAFVTATDTGVGKTEAASALLSLLADEGRRPVPFKPYESGCEDCLFPADALALRAAARSDEDLQRICCHRFSAPLAPGLAARRLGLDPPIQHTLAVFRSFGAGALVAEGAGGLLAPIDSKRDVIDLIRLLELPVLLVARAGLGTLNHTGLSLEALRRRRLPVLAVLLNHTAAPDDASQDNAPYLAERYGVRVLGPVPRLEDARKRRRAFREALRPLLKPSAR